MGLIPNTSELPPRRFLQSLFLGSNQLSGIVLLPTASLCAQIMEAPWPYECILVPNDPSLCIPDTPEYQAIGVDPIGGLPLTSDCPVEVIPIPSITSIGIVMLFVTLGTIGIGSLRGERK